MTVQELINDLKDLAARLEVLPDQTATISKAYDGSKSWDAFEVGRDAEGNVTVSWPQKNLSPGDLDRLAENIIQWKKIIRVNADDPEVPQAALRRLRRSQQERVNYFFSRGGSVRFI
jgi:hypothetical protein